MVRSMYAAVAGLRAHQSKMDVIGNNIANVNTYGYKSARATFQDSIYQTTRGASDATATYGGMNPSQVGYGSTVASIDLIFGTSSYAPTGKATDCMIDGNGFFLVGQLGKEIDIEEQTELKSLQVSRVGNFFFDGNGNLVDHNGQSVYGFVPPDAGGAIVYDKLGSIKIPKDADGKPLELGSITIDSSGMITGIDDKEQIVVIGQIALANVPNPSALEKSQGPYYRMVANTGTITANKPTEGSTGKLITNGLEMANVDLANEFSEMITTQRGFQANGKIITVTDEMLQELINLKR